MKTKKRKSDDDENSPKSLVRPVPGETEDTKSSTTSLAHQKSKSFIIDPLYNHSFDTSQSEERCSNESNLTATVLCFYHPVQLEQYRLCMMRQQSKNAGMKVYYPIAFLPSDQKVDKTLFFRPKSIRQPKNETNKNQVKISSNGTMEIKLNGNSSTKKVLPHQWVSLSSIKDVMLIAITTLSSFQNDCEKSFTEPASLITNCHQTYWQCNVDKNGATQTWIDASNEKMIDNQTYPHNSPQDSSLSITVSPQTIFSRKGNSVNQIYDFGRQLIGKVRITIPCSQDLQKRQIQLFVGESIDEVENEDPQHFEQSLMVNFICKQNEYEVWQTHHLLAFTYARVKCSDTQVKSIECIENFHPVQYKGAFASSDHIFTKIWMRSAYTLRLCFYQGVIVDGIKRDRLPWAGDLAVSIMVNAYSFFDSKVIQKTLLALDQISILGDNQITHVNSVVDYSLWWIISHHLYQLYFHDIFFLKNSWLSIDTSLTSLLKNTKYEDQAYDGFLNWKESKEDGVDSEKSDWLFIDWGLQESIHKFTSIQILWWWALKSGIALANRVKKLGRNESDRTILSKIQEWKDAKLKLESLLHLHCWDQKNKLWLSCPPHSPHEKFYSRHACILSVVSGFHKTNIGANQMTTEKFINTFSRSDKFHTKVGTPFFKYLECLALNTLDEPFQALKETRKYWKAMMDNGATTFWEAFCEEKSIHSPDNLKMYGRMFGKSLCHSWSSGPCHLIPLVIFGIRPLNDGWSKWTCYNIYEVHNILKKLGHEWASATIPVSKDGYISININEKWMSICIPNKTTLEMGQTKYIGPTEIYFKSVHSPIPQPNVHKWSSPYRKWHYYNDHVIPAKPSINGFEDIVMTDVPTIFQLPDEDESRWYMSFIGYDNKGYQSFVAESRNLINWENFRLAFGYGNAGEFDFGGRVLGGYLYENYSVKSRRILKRVNGKFWCLFGSYAKQGSYEIDPGYEGVAYSDDGLIWHRAKAEPILSVHDESIREWESGCIYQPWLIEINGQYFNLYNAKASPPNWIEQIGLATSNDLLNWRRYSSNPVLKVRPGSFHDHFAAGGKVYWDDNAHQWVMFFFGVDKSNHAHIMIAFSHDLYHWVVDENPLYKAGGHPLGLDMEHAHKTSLVWNQVKKCWFLFYCAVGKKGRGIGLISSVDFT